MKRTISIIGTSGAVMLGVAACGGSSSPAPAANSSTAPTPAASASANAAGGTAAGGATGAARGGRGGGAAFAGLANELPQIKQCLTAAGISTADLPTAIPSGRPSGAPRPSFNPSNRPTARPSGGFRGGAGGAGGGFFTIFRNSADVAALKACGITVPTFTRPGGAGFGDGATGGQGGAVPAATPSTT